MKSAALHMARAIRVTCVLAPIARALVFSVTLFSQGNFGRFLGIVLDRTGGVLSRTTVTIIDKDRAVGLLPEEEKWECVVSW